MSSETPATNKPAAPTVQVVYATSIGDNSGKEERFKFFEEISKELVDKALVEPTTPAEAAEKKAATDEINKILLERRGTEMLAKHKWVCVGCSTAGATILLSKPMSYLHLEQPRVIDFLAPCCKKPSCIEHVKTDQDELAAATGGSGTDISSIASIIDGAVKTNSNKDTGSICCNHLCGRSGATMVCAGCKEEVYCNRECQKLAWKAGHKAACKGKKSKSSNQ